MSKLPGILTLLCVFYIGSNLPADTPIPFERESQWNGYRQLHFKIAGRAAYIVVPKQAAPAKPWVWRARFPGYHAEMDITLLGKGYHIAYVDVAELFGSPRAVKIGDQFYAHLLQHDFHSKPALEGVSRGGLFVYNWTANNPNKVACIYCDTPVMDFKSWPAGNGGGIGSAPTWQRCLKAYDFDERQAFEFARNPIDHAMVIANAKIPILHIVSENDRVVPPSENTYVLQARLNRIDYPMKVISVPLGTDKSHGHHFSHPQPQRVVEFIVEHTSR